MEEKTHIFYGFLIGSFVLICMSMYHTVGLDPTEGLSYIWLLIGDAITILVWEVAIRYHRKATSETDGNNANFERKYVKWNAAAWWCNFVMMLLTIVLANFTDTHASSTYAIIGLLICVCGACYCNIDTMSLGRNPLRNPFTHSFILPFIIWWYAFLVLSYDASENFLIIFPAMFCLGAASHLLLDTMPADAGFIKRFEEFFNVKYSSKEIRYISEKKQHLWLLISAVILLICFGFSIPRFYGTYNFIWSLPEKNYLPSLALYPFILIIIVGIIGIGGFAIVFLRAWKKNR